MIDMQHYRDISARVKIRPQCREEVIAMAMQAEKQQHRRPMRKLGIVLAAAAVAAGGMTAAAGAANNWDYRSIFTKYFSEKTDSAVEYDFTPIGQNLDVQGEFPFGTVTLESMLSTPYLMYLSWNVEPNEAAGVSPDDMLWSFITVMDSVNCNLMSNEASAARGEDGKWHFTAKFRSTNGALEPNPTDFYVSTFMRYDAENTADDAIIAKDDTDHKLTFTPQITPDPAMQPLSTPISLAGGTADHYALSPLALVLSDAFGSTPPERMLSAYTEQADASAEVTAVFADGTEQVIPAEVYRTLYTQPKEGAIETTDAPDGFRCYLEFAQPVAPEALTAIRVNGTEIPLG